MRSATHCGIDPFVTLGASLCPYILDLISSLKYHYKEALAHGAAAIGFVACSGGK